MKPTIQFYFLATLVTLLLVMKLGCVTTNVGQWTSSARYSDERSLSSPSGNAIVVRTGNGRVTLSRGGASDTSINATLVATTKERLADAKVVADRQPDGSLLVTVAWPGGHALSGEGCSFDITVPDATAGTTVETSNGAITLLASLTGPARLQTSNAQVDVTDHRGPVRAQTSNGAIYLTDIAGDVDAQTSNGRIDVKHVTGKATARTTNGSVDLSLASASKGPVEIETTNGSATLTLPTSYAGQISLDTSNGSITYPQSATIHDLSAGKNHATLSVGQGNSNSTVQTSNGSVQLRFAD